MADITMPQLGETVTEGTITKWLKQVGDRVEADEVLFEVSTDKVDSEVPSPVAGFVAEILVAEGETVDVGTRLAVLTEEAPAGGAAPAPEAAAPAAEPAPEEPEPEPEPEPKSEAAKPEPKQEPAPEAAAPAPAATAAPVPRGDGNGGKVLSPVVRRLIAEHGLDPGQIDGTGAGGRITRQDVLALVDAAGGSTRTAPRPAPAPSAAPTKAPTKAPAAAPAQAPAPAAADEERAPAAEDEMVPFNNIRRRTAEHMVRSLATSAHVLVVAEVDYEAVDRVRRAERERFKAEEGFSLTYLPFVSRAVVDALAEFPHVNASVGENALVVHRRIHLGVAVDLNFEGLIVPVIHDVETLRLRAIAREIADLAARARSKKLTADDIAGGTFTITNPGPFGTSVTAAVINQPQVAILATDGVKKRPVVVELPDGTDGIAVHPVGNLSLSFDHRAFDGAYASAFLDKVKTIIETRDWSEEL